jgi:hypothetical protein
LVIRAPLLSEALLLEAELGTEPSTHNVKLTGTARKAAGRNQIRRMGRVRLSDLCTPGMGVIFMGCKSPVRDWES